MSSHAAETPTIATDPIRETAWPYVLEWLIVMPIHITFTTEEGGQRISRLGNIENLEYSGDDLTLKVRQCAFRVVGDETSGDEWNPGPAQNIKIKMGSTPVSISEQGRVSFESDGVRYHITPEKLSRSTSEVLAALFG